VKVKMKMIGLKTVKALVNSSLKYIVYRSVMYIF